MALIVIGNDINLLIDGIKTMNDDGTLIQQTEVPTSKQSI